MRLVFLGKRLAFLGKTDWLGIDVQWSAAGSSQRAPSPLTSSGKQVQRRCHRGLLPSRGCVVRICRATHPNCMGVRDRQIGTDRTVTGPAAVRNPGLTVAVSLDVAGCVSDQRPDHRVVGQRGHQHRGRGLRVADPVCQRLRERAPGGTTSGLAPLALVR